MKMVVGYAKLLDVPDPLLLERGLTQYARAETVWRDELRDYVAARAKTAAEVSAREADLTSELACARRRSGTLEAEMKVAVMAQFERQ